MNYLAIGRLLEDTPAASGDTWSWLVTEVSIFLQVCGGCMYLTKPKMAVNCGTWSIFICTSPNHQTNHSQPQSYGDVLHPQKYSKHGLAHRVTISPTMLMGRLPDSASTARSAATLNRDSSCNNDSFISMQTWGRNTDHHWSSFSFSWAWVAWLTRFTSTSHRHSMASLRPLGAKIVAWFVPWISATVGTGQLCQLCNWQDMQFLTGTCWNHNNPIYNETLLG